MLFRRDLEGHQCITLRLKFALGNSDRSFDRGRCWKERHLVEPPDLDALLLATRNRVESALVEWKIWNVAINLG